LFYDKLLPLAIQYGMPLSEFWHGDMRLFEAYEKAYIRNVSYTAWLNGKFNYIAHSVALANGFAKKGSPAKDFPDWKDPVPQIIKPKIKNIEKSFRKSQIEQNKWLNSIMNK
jgi:hypothetical protein